MQQNIRKIIVGDNYSYNIKYVKGAEYRVGAKKCTITDFIVDEQSEQIDIYVTDGNSRFLWKTVNAKPLEVEYDVNFE
jgi:hypothetical protein